MTSLTLGSRTVDFTYFQSGGHQTAKLATASDHSPTTVSYDAAGNETPVGSGTFTYSPRNYLASGDNLAYSYDGRGLRVATTRTGVTLFPVRLALNPMSVQGGNTVVTVSGTVTLNDSTGGTVVLASSDATVASVPPSVPVSAGQLSANFSVTTFAVVSDQRVTITATLNGVAVTATLTVTSAAKLVLLSFSPRTVQGGGGRTSTGTVTLNGGAPGPSGAMVMLTSTNPAVTVPVSVTVPQNQATATFTATTSAVTSSTSVDVTAMYGGVTQHASLLLVPYAVQRRVPAAGENPVLIASLALSKAARYVFGRGDWEPTSSLRPGWLGDRFADEGGSFLGSGSLEAIDIALAASPPGPPKRNFIYSPEMNLLAESELSWPREKTILYEYIWFNGHPVAQVDSGTVTHWTFTDHLGTPLIQTDAAGAVFWRAEYEPYGKVFAFNPPTLADQHQPLRLPGQEAEQFNLLANGISERFYNIFRWYRYGWGRYTQRDLFWTHDPEQGISPYGYANSDPLAFTDPAARAPVNVFDSLKQKLCQSLVNKGCDSYICPTQCPGEPIPGLRLKCLFLGSRLCSCYAEGKIGLGEAKKLGDRLARATSTCEEFLAAVSGELDRRCK